MCGLLFRFDAMEPGKTLEVRARAALARMGHRGPDGEGTESGSGWVMGHRRLAVIDVPGSAQPMCDPARRWFLAYNGEVYNYHDLKRDLAKSWRFRTEGDTEVVLAGLVLEGTAFLDKMEGMWAIALWDDEARRLLLVRDRMGKKPLYYTLSPRGIACASELPALRSVVPGQWSEDADSTADYLRYGYCLPGYTAWRQVREVLPGHGLTWGPDQGEPSQARYWSVSRSRFADSRTEALDCLRHDLTEAVRRRLVADVEVGAFLSGGIDSSLVVGLAARVLGQRVKTFTIGFDDRTYDESPFAERAAAHFQTEHHAETFAGFDSRDLDTLLLDHLGQPFQDSSLLPTTMVSRVAARHVKVALSGDGGDELFGGYQRYQARAILRWYTRLPRAVRGNLHRLVRCLPEPDSHHSRSLLKKAHLFCDAAERVAEESPYVAPLVFRRDQRFALAPDLADHGHPPPLLVDSTHPDDLDEMLLGDALVYLPQDILVKVDRASMAESLEVRAPFLDRRIVELAFSLPTAWHLRAGQGKRMLRAAFPDLLPEWLWRRRKQGFGVPIHAWFRGSLGDRTLELAIRVANSPLAPAYVESLLSEHRGGVRDHGHRLWLVYAYLLWKEQGA